jgi:hypothetical protein
MGLGEAPVPSAPKPLKKAATRKSAAPIKNASLKIKPPTKKTIPKRPVVKKSKSPAKKV